MSATGKRAAAPAVALATAMLAACGESGGNGSVGADADGDATDERLVAAPGTDGVDVPDPGTRERSASFVRLPGERA